MTLDHIAPQRPSRRGPGAGSVESIGNVILVPEPLNVKLKNVPAARRFPKYRKNPDVYVDDSLIGASMWGKRQITKRASTLAAIAQNEIWGV
jgi:hypothetical protein